MRELVERENGERSRRRERMGRELREMEEGGARGELRGGRGVLERKWRELVERENGERARRRERMGRELEEREEVGELGGSWGES